MNSQAAPVVALGNVGKTFDRGRVALDGFNLNVRAGEFVSLLGPSGCGKSTALRIIAGLGEASAGTVETSARQAGDIGFVFQDPTLMPWARVAGNVHLPLKLTHAQRGVDAVLSRAAVDRVLAQVGLSDFENAFPRELSGGMKMRVSIARALVTEPHLLLMDEPFAALDEITRFKLNNDLLALWQELRRTVIFVTHSVFEAVYLSQRIIVMTPRPGRVFAEIDIPAPYPREDRYRMSSDYAGYCHQVADALMAAMAEEGR